MGGQKGMDDNNIITRILATKQGEKYYEELCAC